MKDYPQELKNIEERIDRLKNDNKPQKKKVSFAREYNQAVCAVIDFVSPVFVGICIGYLLDDMLHILPLCMIIFATFGLAAGILNIYKIYGATNTEKQE